MPPHLTSPANVNHLWAALLVEELVRQGVGLFVVCPGSRSTPLAVAVAENPRAEALVHWDERAAAFVALGWGRATGRPAAVVTTSGTAVANLLPAAVEADAAGVPLLLLTADRPPELRETGANQTVRQPPVFQDVARWTLDWPVPTTDVPARWVLSTAAHAVHRSRQPPGPVHLNLPFREPLAATPDGTDPAAYLEDVGRWAAGGGPFVGAPRPTPSPEAAPHIEVSVGSWSQAERGVIAVGELPGDTSDRTRAAMQIGALSEALGWPVLPDVRTALRVAEGFDFPIVQFVDLTLTSETFRERYRADAVLHVGGRLVSKRLSRFLAESRPETYVRLSGAATRSDPDSVVTDDVQGPLAATLAVLLRNEAQMRRTTGGAWMRAWLAASEAVAGVLDRQLDRLSEPAVARETASQSPVLVVASSMPIRDVEAYAAPVPGLERTVIANRGASGIDGTVATAVGYARGRLGLTALVGDLALLHDLTSLALLRDGPPVVVVVVNNDGGGIFHRLPIANGEGELVPDTFERFFGTPHGLTFEAAARQFGISYHAPKTLSRFEAVLREARHSGASALIEVRTDRKEQTALRARIEAEVAAAVDAVGPPWAEHP